MQSNKLMVTICALTGLLFGSSGSLAQTTTREAQQAQFTRLEQATDRAEVANQTISFFMYGSTAEDWMRASQDFNPAQRQAVITTSEFRAQLLQTAYDTRGLFAPGHRVFPNHHLPEKIESSAILAKFGQSMARDYDIDFHKVRPAEVFMNGSLKLLLFKNLILAKTNQDVIDKRNIRNLNEAIDQIAGQLVEDANTSLENVAESKRRDTLVAAYRGALKEIKKETPKTGGALLLSRATKFIGSLVSPKSCETIFR